MEIKLKWRFAEGELDTKTMKLVCVPAFASKRETDACLAIKEGYNFTIAEIHTGNCDSSNELCKEIARRFNEFPEELKK